VSSQAVSLEDELSSIHLEYLDEKIDAAPVDMIWTAEISDSVVTVLSEWPGAGQDNIKCSQYACRLEISSGRPENAEKIIDGLNNISSVEGERMIQFDSQNKRAVVYFGRNGSVSLLNADGF
jgi:hypothetical protein